MSYAVTCHYSDEPYGATYLFENEKEAKDFLLETFRSLVETYPDKSYFITSNGNYAAVYDNGWGGDFSSIFILSKVYM